MKREITFAGAQGTRLMTDNLFFFTLHPRRLAMPMAQ
jgi:hypothetical protein